MTTGQEPVAGTLYRCVLTHGTTRICRYGYHRKNHDRNWSTPLPRLLASLNAQGGFPTPESYAWHRAMLQDERRAALYDPRVRRRIERGARVSAADYIDLLQARPRWIAQMEAAMAGFDALLSPTVPIVAPTIASVAPADGRDAEADAARDKEFTRVNGLLLRNTSVINMLDGCALSLPCHAPGELPVGLMAWHGAMRDDAVLQLGLLIEQALDTGLR